MAEIDNYLQPRIAITENVDLQHIQEAGGFFPLCGMQLLVKKGNKVNKQYQIAHIYPNDLCPCGSEKNIKSVVVKSNYG